MAVVLQTDLRGLAALVTRSFVQNNLVVNDYLPLVRIECKLLDNQIVCIVLRYAFDYYSTSLAVDITGEPQPFDAIRQHSRPELCARRHSLLNAGQWKRHVDSMRDLNILAGQASEFKYHRMRTEGKSSAGLCKPDLIPLAAAAASVAVPSTLSPHRLSNEADSSSSGSGSAEHNSQMRRPSPRSSPRTSPLRLIPEQAEEIGSPAKRIVVAAAPAPALQKSDLEAPLAPAETATTDAKRQPAQQIVEKTVDPPTPSTTTAVVSPTGAEPTTAAAAKKPTIVSSRSNNAPRPTLPRSKGTLLACKPPNVLIYSESTATRDAVMQTLAALLVPDMYTVYPIGGAEVRAQIWLENTTMLVVCGTVAADIGAILTEFFLRGGKMLSLCSDVLHIVLPSFRTHAEVREHELVQFSYARWQRVRMMHHIFCYQPSPVRKHFSTDSGDEAVPSSAIAGGGTGGTVSKKP